MKFYKRKQEKKTTTSTPVTSCVMKGVPTIVLSDRSMEKISQMQESWDVSGTLRMM